MKVIDLLNKIANGEEVPKKVKAGYYYYEYEEKGEYINVDDIEDLLFDFDSYFPLEVSLNQEVEVIEEDKKIDRIENHFYYEEQVGKNEILKNKINEIIDKLNEGE